MVNNNGNIRYEVNYLNNEYETDNSGIHTLGGFSYQIRVFAYYLSKLNPNMQLEFEKYDDVSMNNIDLDYIDSNEDNFKNIIVEDNGIQAIQVKRTKLDNKTALKVLMNWILLENSGNLVSKYILFTSDEYNNKNNLFHMTAEQLFAKINKAKLENKPRSIIGKLKKQFNNDKDLFINIYKLVESKVKFKSIEDIDDEIKKAYVVLFRRRNGEDKEIVYIQRIKALLEKLTYEILEMVNSKRSYSINHSDFMELIEKITLEIRDDNPVLGFYKFKQSCKELDISDKSICDTREYAQLKECNLPLGQLKSHMIYMLYYGRFRLLNMERNKEEKIEAIEDTTYDNFFMAKQRLKIEKNDIPFLRLDETKQKSNEHADNEQLKWGSAIYLTKEKTDDDKKISWKDE